MEVLQNCTFDSLSSNAEIPTPPIIKQAITLSAVALCVFLISLVRLLIIDYNLKIIKNIVNGGTGASKKKVKTHKYPLISWALKEQNKSQLPVTVEASNSKHQQP